MEISTLSQSSPVAAEEDKEDKEDTAATSLSIHTTHSHSHSSDVDESNLEELAKDQTQTIKSVDKGKGQGRDQKKHGVMSLPAEIRETYAFQWSAWSHQRLLKFFFSSST